MKKKMQEKFLIFSKQYQKHNINTWFKVQETLKTFSIFIVGCLKKNLTGKWYPM